MLRANNIDEHSFDEILVPCIHCLYWQTGEGLPDDKLKLEKKQKKLEWFAETVRKFGNCLKIIHLDNRAVGFIQYAPAAFFPNTKEYASGPASEDAVFIACLYIAAKETRGKGFGTAILQDLLKELRTRGFKAVETFARRSSEDNPSGPLNFYLKNEFKIIEEKSDFPLVRLEL